jgi:hypothetical protein
MRHMIIGIAHKPRIPMLHLEESLESLDPNIQEEIHEGVVPHLPVVLKMEDRHGGIVGIGEI